VINVSREELDGSTVGVTTTRRSVVLGLGDARPIQVRSVGSDTPRAVALATKLRPCDRPARA
jgi:hypothetical protein